MELKQEKLCQCFYAAVEFGEEKYGIYRDLIHIGPAPSRHGGGAICWPWSSRITQGERSRRIRNSDGVISVRCT